MDRQIVYPGQILPETSLLQMTKDAMIGTAKLASALLGTNTYASGFAVTPTGPASLQVLYAPGEIYSLATIDALAFSTLPADTTHSILKQGILLDGGTLNCPAPGTTGQSINYLVQVTYQDSDASPVLLPYYNSANPAMPFSGAGNNGLTQNTVRKGVAVVSVKAGASATTGTQTTPAPDAGYIGLFAVTVAFGQTTITSGNIAQLATAPLINSTLHGLSPAFTVSPVIPPAAATNQAVQFGQMSGVVGAARNVSMAIPSASTSAAITADEVLVESALGGLRYCVAALNKTINIAGTGVGGMDTGLAPVSGSVGIYAIYNPTTGASALLAVDASTVKAPEVYGGANMPAGYTASALISVRRTNGSRQFLQGNQFDRVVTMQELSLLNTTAVPASPTSVLSAAIPMNARSIGGNMSVSSTSTSSLQLTLVASAANDGKAANSGNVAAGDTRQVPYNGLPILTAQTFFYTMQAAAGTSTAVVTITQYSF